LSPGFNIIWGNLGDSLETLETGVEFLLRYDDGAQLRTIRPVTPYPGSPLYEYAVKNGMLDGVADFYERRHVNSDLASVQFTGLSNEEFHQALCRANKRLLRNYYMKQHGRAVEQTEKLYGGDVGFRGYRQT
jgi:anaerobic magnesium-protoporphyrin IX monomethyl ester cyclase